MLSHVLKKRMSTYFSAPGESNNTLYVGLGPLEIVLIVVAVVLVFGVGKLSQVGGALGKSIREFRKEKDGLGDTPPKLTTKDTQSDKSIGEPGAGHEEENKD